MPASHMRAQRQELRLRIKGATGLQGPNRNAGPFDAFCIAGVGHARYRTHAIDNTIAPEWNHEVVFGSDAVAQGGRVVTLEVWDDGVLTDQLLSKAYIDLDLYDDAEAISAEHGGSSTISGSHNVQQHSLALLPASSKPPARQRAAASKNILLTRSSHVGKTYGRLRVEWWWVDEPAVGTSGQPPRVVSFAAAPGVRKHIPVVSQAAGIVLYEAPCVALVKLSIFEVCFGAAAQVASPHQVLRSVRALLLGGHRAKQEIDSLNSRSGGPSTASSPRGLPPTPPDWQQVSVPGFDEALAGMGHGPGDSDTDSDGSSSDSSSSSGSSRSSGRSSSSNDSKRATRARRRIPHRPLFVVCRVIVGKQDAQSTKPVAIGSDGTAAVQQCVTLPVLRPLVDHEVVFELQLQRTRRSRPPLTLQCRYSLLDLLLKSPQQPWKYEEWHNLRTNTLPGVHVPMPGLPEAYMDLGACLADTDCRAGIYDVPAVAVAADAGRHALSPVAEAAETAETAQESAASAAAGNSHSNNSPSRKGQLRAAFSSLRRRFKQAAGHPPAQQQPSLRQSAAKAGHEVWHDQVKPGLEAKMGSVAEATKTGMARAVSLLPAPVARRVSRGMLGKLLAPRSEVLCLGQVPLPAMSRRTSDASEAATAAHDDFAHHSEDASPLPGASSSSHASCEAPAAALPVPAPAQHPNVAVSGGPGAGPVALVRLTLRRVTLEGDHGYGVTLLLRSGPHWLHVEHGAVPICVGDGPPSPDTELQVVLPVFVPSQFGFTMVLQRRGVVLAMHTFQAYGLMPLLLREHTKTVSMYSAAHGHSTPVARITLSLAASPVPGHGGWRWAMHLAISYLLTPDTLALHTSAIAASSSRRVLLLAHAQCVGQWLASVEPELPAPVVAKVLGLGHRKVSLTHMKNQVTRIKTCLAWVPRRMDPAGFYHWRKPWQNILVLWVLSQVCFHPDKWILTLCLLAFVWMLRRCAIQLREGILGFELVAQQNEDEDESIAMTNPHRTATTTAPGSSAPIPHTEASAATAFLQRRRRQRKQERAEAAELGEEVPAAAAGLSLAALDNLDLDELASVRGLLRLATKHVGEVGGLAFLLQEWLEAAATGAEKVYAVVTGRDMVAALVAYSCALCTGALAARFGLGMVVYCWLLYLLRPPMLRGVPGVIGPRAFFQNVSSRSSDAML